MQVSWQLWVLQCTVELKGIRRGRDRLLGGEWGSEVSQMRQVGPSFAFRAPLELFGV